MIKHNVLKFSCVWNFHNKIELSLISANIGLDEGVRCLEDVFHFRLQKTSSRRLQDVVIKSNIFTLLICLQKTFSRHFQDFFKTSSRRIAKTYILPRCLQDVFKTSLRSLAKMSLRRPQNVFKTSCKNVFKRFQDVLQTSSRHLQDILKTSSKDVFKTFSRRIIRLSCLPRSRISLGHTSQKFMVSVENLQV